MKLLLSLKTLYRTPVRTIFTILLIAATSFSMFYSVAENTVITREYKRTASAYQGVGAVEAGSAFSDIPFHGGDSYLYMDPRNKSLNSELLSSSENYAYMGLASSDVNTIASLPQVSKVSTRYMTAGVSDSFNRIDHRGDYYNFTARFVIEATFDNFAKRRFEVPGSDIEIYSVNFKDVTVLAGDAEWFANRNKDISMEAMTFRKKQMEPRTVGSSGFGDIERGAASSVVGRTQYDELYTLEFLESLVKGSRYIIVGRVEPLSMGGPMFFMTDSTTLGWWDQVRLIDGYPGNYLALDEFAPLNELIEATNTDLHTFDVVYTDSMEYIMRFANGKMGVTEGRLLTPEDTKTQSNACVVSEVFLKANGLQIGDEISLRLGDVLFEQNAALGAVASTRERRSGTFTESVFEIVGVYADLDSKRSQAESVKWSYSVNTIFVPLSSLPVEIPEDHIVKPGEFTFVIEDAGKISAFLEESAPTIKDELGLTMFFTDGGWLSIEQGVKNAETLTGIRLVTLALANVIAIALTVYLFIGRKKRDYAVMRALGTKKSIANRTLYIPLGVIAAIAILAGNAFAFYYASGTVESALGAYAELGIEADATIPVSVAALLVGAQMLVLALITALYLLRLSLKQPLVLLQDSANKQGSRKAAKKASPSADCPAESLPETQPGGIFRVSDGEEINAPVSNQAAATQRADKGYTAAGHIINYVTLHMRRSVVKSALSIILALLLFGSLGQYMAVRDEYSRMYEGVEIKAYFVDGLNLTFATRISESGYVTDPYYEYTLKAECELIPVSIAMTNDIGKYAGGAVEVEFMEGYNESSMAGINVRALPICILDAETMDAIGVNLGDEVSFNIAGLFDQLKRAYIDESDDEATAALQWDRLWERLDGMSAVYTVVGRAISGAEQGVAVVPVSPGLSNLTIGADTLDLAEYTLIHHSMADEFRDFANKTLALASAASIGSVNPSFVMDTSGADRILRTVELFDTLYPIAAVVAAVLGGLFPCLIILNSSREAAIMRALGTTKKRVRAMLTLEQLLLCLFGLTAGAAVILAINGQSAAGYISALSIYCLFHLALCFVGAIFSSVIVSHRKTMELLQVKE